MSEQEFKQQVSMDVKSMMEKLTFEEQMQVAYTPLIISHMAWEYARMAADAAKEERIYELKKANRVLKQLRQAYLNGLRADLDARHLQAIWSESERLMGDIATDLFKHLIVVKEDLQRLHPEADHTMLRSYALMAQLMVRFLDEHGKESDELLQSRIEGISKGRTNPRMIALSRLMDAYTGGATLDMDGRNLSLCMKILKNNIKKIQYNII